MPKFNWKLHNFNITSCYLATVKLQFKFRIIECSVEDNLTTHTHVQQRSSIFTLAGEPSRKCRCKSWGTLACSDKFSLSLPAPGSSRWRWRRCWRRIRGSPRGRRASPSPPAASRPRWGTPCGGRCLEENILQSNIKIYQVVLTLWKMELNI